MTTDRQKTSIFGLLLSKYGTVTLTPEQLAIESHVHPSYIRALLRDGGIRGLKHGKRWIIPITHAAEFLEGAAND